MTNKLLIAPPEIAISYNQYLRNVEEMVEQGSTSGPNQSESLINYTKLNFRRMSRLNKTITVEDELKQAVEAFSGDMDWIVITEAWCGDAAQNLPFIAKLAESAINVNLGLVYRDENQDYMQNYLTNGSRSIPKLISYERKSGKELFTWGPRPAIVQRMVMDYKKQVDHEKLPMDKFSESIHLWYAKDKNQTLKTELLHIFQGLA